MTRVVDDYVKGRVKLGHEGAELLKYSYVPEVQPKHVQSSAPACAVVLLQEPLGSVHGKACGHDEVRSTAEQFQAALETDFLPATGDERIPDAKELTGKG